MLFFIFLKFNLYSSLWLFPCFDTLMEKIGNYSMTERYLSVLFMKGRLEDR